jgi:hypothetical protein
LVVLSTTGDLSAFVAPENSGPVHARLVGLRGLKSPSQNKGRYYYLNTDGRDIFYLKEGFFNVDRFRPLYQKTRDSRYGFRIIRGSHYTDIL